MQAMMGSRLKHCTARVAIAFHVTLFARIDYSAVQVRPHSIYASPAEELFAHSAFSAVQVSLHESMQTVMSSSHKHITTAAGRCFEFWVDSLTHFITTGQ